MDDELVVGDARVSDASDLGSTKRVVSNDGTTSYLMKIKKEWYNEDQKAKAAQIDEVEKSMRSDAEQAGFYGKLKISND